MSIRIEIIADNFEQMVHQLGGAARMFIAVPAGSIVKTTPAAEEVKAAPVDPPVEAEVIDPPKKPRGRPPQVKVIDAEAISPAVAEVVETRLDAAEAKLDALVEKAAEPVKVLDFEKDMRPAIVAYVNDLSDQEDPASKKKMFDELVTEFKVARASEIKPEDYPRVLEFIKAKRAAAGK